MFAPIFLLYRPLLRLHVILPLLKVQHIRIQSLGLRNQEERQNSTEDVAREENPQHIRQPNHILATEEVEQQRRENGTHFAHGGAEAMAKTAHARGENLCGDDEGRGVGAEVKEELCKMNCEYL